MADKKNTTQVSTLNTLLGISPSASRWVALFTVAPTDTTEGTEVTEAAYTRMLIAFGAPSGDPASTTNTAQIDFPIATGGSYTVVAVAICTAVSGTGNQVYFKAVTNKTIAIGDRYQLPLGSVSVQEN